MTLTPAQRRKIREKKLSQFDPDFRYNPEHIFGLPFDAEESEIIVLPVPWDISSRMNGSSEAPERLLEASQKISLYHPEFPDVWKMGISMESIPYKWKESSDELKKIESKIIHNLHKKLNKSRQVEQLQRYKNINYTTRLLNEWVSDRVHKILEAGRISAVLGGNHGVSYGAIHAYSEKYKHLGVLHLDAHPAFKSKPLGFEHSHDSLMRQVLDAQMIPKIVQVGIRETSYEEMDFYKKNTSRIKVFFDAYLKEKLNKGTTWKILINEILSALPSYIYVSVDIDVLRPEYCPNSDKLVPGGLDYYELTALLTELARSGKQIVGFDLCGISPDKSGRVKSDVLTGVHLLYHLCCAALFSRTK